MTPPTGPDEVDRPSDEAPASEVQAPQDRHHREVHESRREERRLAVWEVVCLLLVVAFVVVRQLWLD
jgi:hypothetical protein